MTRNNSKFIEKKVSVKCMFSAQNTIGVKTTNEKIFMNYNSKLPLYWKKKLEKYNFWWHFFKSRYSYFLKYLENKTKYRKSESKNTPTLLSTFATTYHMEKVRTLYHEKQKYLYDVMTRNNSKSIEKKGEWRLYVFAQNSIGIKTINENFSIHC